MRFPRKKTIFAAEFNHFIYEKAYLIFGSLLCIFSSVAEEAVDERGKEMTSIVIRSGNGQARPQRVPANVDLFLIVGNEEVTILFNGDFGHGLYQLTETNSGESISKEVSAYYGYSEVIPFSADESASLDFTIMFDNGNWCQISWH